MAPLLFLATGAMLTKAATDKPKTVEMPPVPPPPATPESEIYEEAGEFAKKKTRRRRGKLQTIVTGELEPETTKRTLLG